MPENLKGSLQGLIKNRDDTKRANTEALWSQVNRLRKEKPNSLWTFKEVWKNAGLKSNVALDSPWNAHIKEAIRDHNKSIKENIDVGPVVRAKERRCAHKLKI